MKRIHTPFPGRWSIASTWVRRRRGSGVRALPGHGTRQGSGGQRGPSPLGYASHFRAQARQ